MTTQNLEKLAQSALKRPAILPAQSAAPVHKRWAGRQLCTLRGEIVSGSRQALGGVRAGDISAQSGFFGGCGEPGCVLLQLGISLLIKLLDHETPGQYIGRYHL